MRRVAASIVLTVICSGCGFLSSKPSKFYSLERVPGTVTQVRGTPVGIDIVELPAGLNRKEVAVRQSDHRLEIRGREQWTAILQPLVLHTLSADLADRLPVGMVLLPGQAKPMNTTRSIDVVFEELAPGPDNRVNLDARWTLRDAAGATLLSQHDVLTVDIPSLSSPDIALGMSQALAQLADRMVTQLAK